MFVALMPVGRMTRIGILALCALHRPATVRQIFPLCRAGIVAFRVVSTIAFLAGYRIAHIPVPVALTRTTRITGNSSSSEVARNARVTAIPIRKIFAPQTHGIRLGSFGQIIVQLNSGHVPHDRFQFFRNTKIGMAVAIFATWYTFSITSGITNEKRHTFFTLRAKGVVMAM